MLECSICGKKINEDELYILPYSKNIVCEDCLNYIENNKATK